MKCLNCSSEISSNFCPDCGQSKKIRPITNKDLYQELPKSILNVENGFGYTLWSLLKRPIETARDYIEGRRAKYHKPIPFYFIITAVTTIVMSWVLPDLFEQMGVGKSDEAAKVGKSLFELLQNSPAISNIAGIPISALSFYLAFRKYKDSFAVHVYLQIFASAYVNLITFIPLVLLAKYVGMEWAVSGVFFIFVGIAAYYFSYYRAKDRFFSVLWRSLLGLLLLIFFFLFFITVFVLIATLLMKG